MIKRHRNSQSEDGLSIVIHYHDDRRQHHQHHRQDYFDTQSGTGAGVTGR